MPTGTIFDYAGSSAPSGYLVCNGAAVSRATYANLFSNIGTIWGVGDGSTTFNLPNLSNAFSYGSGTNSVGATGGAATVALSTANLPAHSHPVTDPGHTHTVTDPKHTHTVTDPGHSHTLSSNAAATGAASGGSSGSGSTASATTGITNQSASTGITNQTATTGITTGNTGTGTAVNILPPYAVTLKIIKT